MQNYQILQTKVTNYKLLGLYSKAPKMLAKIEAICVDNKQLFQKFYVCSFIYELNSFNFYQKYLQNILQIKIKQLPNKFN